MPLYVRPSQPTHGAGALLEMGAVEQSVAKHPVHPPGFCCALTSGKSRTQPNSSAISGKATARYIRALGYKLVLLFVFILGISSVTILLRDLEIDVSLTTPFPQRRQMTFHNKRVMIVN